MGMQTERIQINMAPPQKKKKKHTNTKTGITAAATAQRPSSCRRYQAQFKTKADSERRGVPQGDLPD